MLQETEKESWDSKQDEQSLEGCPGDSGCN